MSVVPHRRLRRGPAPLLAALAAGLLLAGCSGSGSGSASSSGGEVMSAESAAGAAARPAPAKAAANAAGSAVAAPRAGAVPGATNPRKLAKQASLRLEVAHLAQAAASVRSLAVSLRGLVLTEQLGDGSTPLVPDAAGSLGSGGSSASVPAPDTSGIDGAYAAFTLSVPADQLDTTLAQLGRLGTVVSQSASAQDVTGSYIDTRSRVATMRASVERVRALMSKAKDIGQVVTLEGQLSRRQADLESLQAQLADLQSSVAQSTLSVTLTTAAHHAAPVAAGTGFGSGLAGGWHAFTRSITALLTVLGAVLPFAVLVALLGLPVLWWRRQRSPSSQSQPAA